MGAMKVEFINPFVASTLNVFETMFATSLSRGKIYLRQANETHGGLSGVIGLSGKATGTVAIIVTDATAIKITERFLGKDITAVNEEVIDCIGELINMIAGNAKAQLEQYHLSISLPSIIRGQDHTVEFPSNVTPICIPFTSDIGDMMVQVGFLVKE